MALVLFDLDNTLLNGDSDHAFGEFLISKGIVDGDSYQQKNDQFYQDYQNGSLDIFAYQAFALSPLVGQTADILAQWHKSFMHEVIEPMMLPKALELITKHKSQSDTLAIITATNRFVTGPIATRLGIDHLLATEPEFLNGQITGKLVGVPCFQAGKITHLNQWLKTQQASLKGSWFYSDSHNDLPLLELVDNPVVVDGDDKLLAAAQQRHWPCISLR